MTKRAVLYARKSTIDKAAWAGLESQLELCREYAAADDCHVVGELSEDNVSGADWMTPEIERALDLAEAGVFDVLVVRQMDRLARNLAKQLFIEKQFERSGVSVQYVLEQFDDTPEGVLQKLVKGAIAEYERLETQRRTARGRRARVKAGKTLTGNRPPFGYRESEGVFTIHDEEAAWVRQIFDWYTRDGYGSIIIARMLTERRVLSWADKRTKDRRASFKRMGRGKWNRGTVLMMLENETYAGTWRYATGDTVDVPAIIERAQFDEARLVRQKNRRLSKRRTRYEYLLRGLARCGQCGAMMESTSRKSEGKLYQYYRCTASPYRMSYTCDARFCAVGIVDRAVWAFLRAYLESDEIFGAIAEAMRGDTVARDGLEAERDRLAEELADLEKKRQGLMSFYLDQGWEKAQLDAARDDLNGSIGAVRSHLNTINRQLDGGPERALDAMTETRARLVSRLDDADSDFDTRRGIVERIVERADLNRREASIVVHLIGGAAWDLSFESD